MIVLDTDVISEVLKLTPDRKVVDWLKTLDVASAFATTISLAELRYGVEQLPAGQRRELLSNRIDLAFARDFRGRLLTFDERAAYEFGEMAAQFGPDLGGMAFDIQIAAIARANGAAIATKNVKRFKLFEVPVYNPWAA